MFMSCISLRCRADFQLLCHRTGLSMYQEQCNLVLQRQRVRNEAMHLVRTRYTKKHFYAFEQRSRVDWEEEEEVYRDAFISWRLAVHQVLVAVVG